MKNFDYIFLYRVIENLAWIFMASTFSRVAILLKFCHMRVPHSSLLTRHFIIGKKAETRYTSYDLLARLGSKTNFMRKWKKWCLWKECNLSLHMLDFGYWFWFFTFETRLFWNIRSGERVSQKSIESINRYWIAKILLVKRER